MKKLFNYQGFFTKERTRSLISGLVIFVLAAIFQFYASAYSDRVSSNFVHDIFLDNISVIDLTAAIVEGAFAIIAITFLLVVSRPKYLIFSIKAGALFMATRAMFIAMTHLGIYPDQVMVTTGFFDSIYTDLGLGAGFFFSGHTGMPFLMGLVFWKDKFWRYVFFILAAIMGFSVLLSHMHYSIDVFAAPFITYSIFRVAVYLFPEDYKLSQTPEEV